MIDYKNIKILVFGLGLNQGGVGSAKFFSSGGAKVRVTDLKSQEILQSSLDQLKDFPDIEYVLGEHKNEDIDWADLIIKNPAIKPGNEYIEYAKKQGKRVEQDMGIFLDFVRPEQIVGITGTKGKSTTSSLINVILNEAKDIIKKGVVFAGNIGTSVLDVIPRITPDTLVVLELSSFQLESFDQHQISPKWAVITNITPDHLNYYKNMDEYINAKKVIGKYQTDSDYLFLRKNDPVTTKDEFVKDLKGQIIYFSKEDLPTNFKPYLPGDHNLFNMSASFNLGKVFNIEDQVILQALQSFKGVPFRQELVKEWNGIKIINDTAATSPEAAIQALKTYPGCILICGGMNKGMDYTEFIRVVNDHAKKVFFIEGDSTEEIISSLRAQRSNLEIHTPYNDLEKLLIDVKQVAKEGDIILFSPAATSFNLFQNEFDRGRKFNAAVQKVFS